MIPLLVPIGLGLIGGYLTKDSDHEIFADGGGIAQDKEVSEERYYDMLGVVPPIYFRTLDGISVRGGFAVGEVYSHQEREGKFRGIYDAFYQKGDKYYQVNGMVYFIDKDAAKRARYKEEYAKGGKVEEDLLKELRRLQRELNSHRLSTYIEGDNSEEEMARRREREAKLARFNEVLKLLREQDSKYAKGGGIDDLKWKARVKKFGYKPYGKIKGRFTVHYMADGQEQKEITETKEMAIDTAKRYTKLFSGVSITDESGNKIRF